MTPTTNIRIRGYQVDAFGHVNHARYVEFLEEARWAFFDRHPSIVEWLRAEGITHAVVRLELDYHSSASVGDDLRIETSIAKVGRSSVVVAQEIVRVGDDRLVVSGEVTNVFLDGRTGVPARIREYFAPLTRSEEQGGTP
jgi:thioesterase-3